MSQSYLPISAVIFTKNESKNIAECITSLAAFSEILVVDSASSDDTQKMARDLGAKVINFEWDKQYPKKRQWSLQSVNYTNSWILFVDADERVSIKFVSELQEFMQSDSSKFSAASIPIDYYFAGKRLIFGQKPRKIVLLRLGKVSFPEIDDLGAEGMGELEGHYQPTVDGRIKKFANAITHNDNDPISTWMTRHINYAKWEAHLLLNDSAKSKVEKSKGPIAAVLHKLPFRPLLFFIYSYVLKFGFLDGKAGFDYAFAKSWYYWLSAVIARENKQRDRNA
jgi:glycosyltransferase involved in cell wall biosynthesis